MKTSFAKFITAISIILVLLASPSPTWSCGPELDPDEARFCVFHADVSDQENLTIFNYTPRYLNYNLDSASVTDMDKNCAEWQAFTKNKVPIRDIKELQYDTNADTFLSSYLNRNLDRYNNNLFVHWLQKKKNKKALEYFAFAKHLEYLQTELTAWDTAKIDGQYDSLAKYAAAKCDEKMPEFLRERYAFQAVKCYFYSKYYPNLNWDFTSPELIDCYKKYLSKKSSIVASWALIYYARVQEDSNKQTLYLARCFDRCDDKKDYIYQFLDHSSLQSLEAVTTNKKDLILIHCLQSLLTPGRAAKDLDYVFKNDPCNKYIPTLITREINKLEDWIYSPDVLGFASTLKESEYYNDMEERGNRDYTNDTPYSYYAQNNIIKDRLYLKHFRSQLLSMVASDCSYKDLLYLSIAHLYNMENNGSEAKRYIARVTSTKYKLQAAIEEFIATTLTEDITTAKTKEHIASITQKLVHTGATPVTTDVWDYEGNYENNDDLSELWVYLGRQYEQKNDLVTAGLLIQNSNIMINEYGYGYGNFDTVSYRAISYFEKHAQPADIEKLLALKHKKNKSNFEKLLTSGIPASDDLLLDLEATLFIRKEDYRSAWKIMQKIPDNFWRDNYEYKDYLPVTSISNLGTILPVPSGPGTKYALPSKKLILQEIIRLQDDVDSKSGTAKANDYFLLGNAYYNMTFYGKAWMMIAYGKSSGGRWDNNDWVYYNLSNKNVDCYKNYYGCKAAINMYQKALSAAKMNKELSAKCLVMLAYCDKLGHGNYDAEKNNEVTDNYSNEQAGYYSPYLYRLRKQYSATNTFARSVSYCPDINEFMTHKK
ncbi:MAG: hypothetical protein ACTHKV_10660 [Flavipsychrobacter sp.]